jgi:hypothetical protein
MPLHHKIFIAAFCLTLAACTKAQDTSTQALDTVGNETSASYNKMRDALDLNDKPKPRPKKIAQPRYCYKTYEDIICYARPLPGEEYRLVGYQSSTGKAGYTLPPTAPAQDPSESVSPSSMPITPMPTTPGKEKDDSQLKEIIFDPSELEPKELVPDKQQ